MGCDVIDDNNVALMMDVSNIVVIFYQICMIFCYNIFAYFICECDTHQSWYGDAVE